MVPLLKGVGTAAKLGILGEVAKFDVSGFPSFFGYKEKKFQRFSFVYPAVGRRGSCVRLFKVLQNNACQGNCYYCANRKDRNFPRISFSPGELAHLFIHYYQKRLVDGLFLSSAIYDSANRSQEEMIKTLWWLRVKLGYRGYIHCKILPGVTPGLIEATAPLADRLSVNLEVPGEDYLKRISPDKKFSTQLLGELEQISHLNQLHPFKAGITTQLVVGAAGETDREILSLSYNLYAKHNLWRVYYSAFMPIIDTPFDNISPCSPLRELRLYQADFLLRHYGFSPAELPFQEEGSLPKQCDPKMAWALHNLDWFPLEVNRADFHELIRVPGIGRISAGRIIRTRRQSHLTTLKQLKIVGAVTSRARDFVTLDGKFFPSSGVKEKKEINEQLFLWEEL